MTKELQTIREALMMGWSCDIPALRRKALAALDALAAELSEDALELVREYIELATTNSEYGVSKRRALELFNQIIIARDKRISQRVREGCMAILRVLPCVNDNETEIRREDAVAAIMGGKE